MARMNVETRIDLGRKMVEQWTAAGLENDRSVTFVSDMILRLGQGKGLTPRQRDWYDSVVVQDPPKPQNAEQVASLRQDAALPGMEKVAEILNDFAFRLSKGWNLSEKQTAFMTKLQAQATDIRDNGAWEPTADEILAIATGVAFCRRYSAYYMDGCPGISKARDECRRWLDGEIAFLDKWSANRMMKLCKGDRTVIADATERWPVGSMAFTKDDNVNHGGFGLVMDTPHVNRYGQPSLLLFIDGLPKAVRVCDLVKPRKTRAKKIK